MSSSNYPFIVLSDSDIKDAFSSTNTPNYTLASRDYFPASPRNTSPDPLNDLTKDLLASLAFLSFHDDPYMKVMQAYDVNNNELHIPPQAPWKWILKKETKTRQKTTKPNTKWKRSKKTKSIEAGSQKSKPVMVTTRNNPNDNVLNFEAMINAAVANALPNLTAALRTQITNDIKNGSGPSGGGGGDVIPYGI
nr:zinc finger, CCHC-type, retrotransposon Gag domain protein [Tanacetum cinerariifolium]